MLFARWRRGFFLLHGGGLMVFGKWTSKEKKILGKLLAGKSRYTVARETGYALSTVNDTAARLVYYNEIRPVPGTFNPVIYESVRNDGIPVGPSPKGNESGKSIIGMTDATKKHVPTPEEKTKDWEFHLKGDIKMAVMHEGEMITVRDKQNRVMAEWIGTGNPPGLTEHIARLYAYDRSIKFHYRIANGGTKNIVFYPGNTYLNEDELKKGEGILIDRVKYISELLRPLGWKMSDHSERNIPPGKEVKKVLRFRDGLRNPRSPSCNPPGP
jgi:hypothetical protein